MGCIKKFISVASWEQRFVLGANRIHQLENPSESLIFCYDQFTERCQPNLISVQQLSSVKLVPLQYSDHVESWKIIKAEITSFVSDCDEIVFDISTAPRESIWFIVFFLHHLNVRCRYYYNRPVGYAPDWLSRNPGRPRLVLKASGIFSFRKQTLLFLATGFDTDRTLQLIRHYEPKKVILALQTGPQYDNFTRNRDVHILLVNTHATACELEIIDLDSYDAVSFLSASVEIIGKHSEDYNILASSLGPKISALSLFNLHLMNKCVGLVYTPSGEFNPDYSEGIGDHVTGSIF